MKSLYLIVFMTFIVVGCHWKVVLPRTFNDHSHETRCNMVQAIAGGNFSNGQFKLLGPSNPGGGGGIETLRTMVTETPSTDAGTSAEWRSLLNYEYHRAQHNSGQMVTAGNQTIEYRIRVIGSNGIDKGDRRCISSARGNAKQHRIGNHPYIGKH